MLKIPKSIYHVNGFLYKYQTGPEETITPAAELHKALGTPHDWVILKNVMISATSAYTYRVCKQCGYTEVDSRWRTDQNANWIPTVNHGLAMLRDFHNSKKSYEAHVL